MGGRRHGSKTRGLRLRRITASGEDKTFDRGRVTGCGVVSIEHGMRAAMLRGTLSVGCDFVRAFSECWIVLDHSVSFATIPSVVLASGRSVAPCTRSCGAVLPR